MTQVELLQVRRGVRLAFSRVEGEPGRSGFFWLSGFKSDMTGTKAEALSAHAAATGRPCLRFDYSGHGQSEGRFEDGTISVWVDDAAQAFTGLTSAPMVVVGSSMGGLLALLLARRLARENPQDLSRIKGLLLIAPAADMTEDLMWAEFSEEARQAIMREGVWLRPSAYGEPYPITRALIEDGRNYLILHEGLDVHCPVRILHGEDDPDVPWEHGFKLYRALRGDDIKFTLIKGGDHRLSTPRDIRTIIANAEQLAVMADAAGSQPAPASPPGSSDRGDDSPALP